MQAYHSSKQLNFDLQKSNMLFKDNVTQSFQIINVLLLKQ